MELKVRGALRVSCPSLAPWQSPLPPAPSRCWLHVCISQQPWRQERPAGPREREGRPPARRAGHSLVSPGSSKPHLDAQPEESRAGWWVLGRGAGEPGAISHPGELGIARGPGTVGASAPAALPGALSPSPSACHCCREAAEAGPATSLRAPGHGSLTVASSLGQLNSETHFTTWAPPHPGSVCVPIPITPSTRGAGGLRRPPGQAHSKCSVNGASHGGKRLCLLGTLTRGALYK